MSMRDEPGTRRVRRRLSGRLAVALIVGPLAGLAVGASIVAVALDSWDGLAIAVVLGAVIASTFLALLWAGYSSLESPDPGREPSDTERPVADRSSLVREERGEPLHGTPEHGLGDLPEG